MNQSVGGIWQGIAVGSLILASLSLVVAIMIPGPQGDAGPVGAQGPQGDQGPPGETINHSALMFGVANPKECISSHVTNVMVRVVNLGDQAALNVIADVYVVDMPSGDYAMTQWSLFDWNPHAYGYFEVEVTSSFNCSSVDSSWVTFTWN